MTSSKLKTKYCELSFHEDHDNGKPFYWASIGMAWGEKANPRAVAFAALMDNRLLELTREHLNTAVTDAIKDIYLEDVDLLVNLRAEDKHQGAKLIGIVEKVEAEFDALASEVK